ncbi:MAG: XRE family transcriptional regulator [Rhodospirillaceae bacterium]|nr:MAG: XRE family transcriptional regulator [Rhodospirillaceae bacterium]
MGTAVKKTDTRPVRMSFDPRKGRNAIEGLARRAARLRDSGKVDSVILPVGAVADLAEMLEDIEDVAAIQARASETRVPHEVVVAIHDGTHPVRAWRKHRGLTLQALATAGGLPAPYISEIETGKKPGSVAAFKAMAKALGTDIDMLVAE